MATLTNNFILKSISLHSTHPKLIIPPHHHRYSQPFLTVASSASSNNSHRKTRLITKATSSAASGNAKQAGERRSDERVQKVHSIEEFDEALRAAKSRLVVVEYAERDSFESKKIYPFMVDLSRTCSDVEFLLVLGDESEKTRALCKREKVEQVPHFSFYKNMEKIHEEEGIGPDQLVGDVLYYGDSHSLVEQLHSREDVEKLINDHKEDDKLVVLDVGLKHCGPCVKVYPTVVKLSRQMADSAVFARMNGDENDSCMQFLRDMDVVEVPTFLFIRDGKIQGRYVGSGKGELIGEILRYQGILEDQPNKNYFSPWCVIPMIVQAILELIRSFTIAYLNGPHYKEGWFLFAFRTIGILIPGLPAHGPQDYLNSTLLGSIDHHFKVE